MSTHQDFCKFRDEDVVQYTPGWLLVLRLKGCFSIDPAVCWWRDVQAYSVPCMLVDIC